ncbi:MAG: 4Fe-4S dicluster domain-containing protein [Deltaproteobacteria bacterium]|jgi:Fe-S-cluster-containing hydrogenase component 2|nr:4Fe-4S dicluster domain-containing protein [Deltaproteobacteria bacterium]
MKLAKTLQLSPSRCIGCLNCVLACSSRDWADHYPAPSKINLVFFKDGGQVPITCFQCDNAPCLGVCRTGALERAGSGVLKVDPTRCVGCRACVAVCPFGNISYSLAGKAATKCDQCEGSPRCALSCPSGAIRYVEDEDIIRERREAFARSLKAAGDLL